MAGALNINKQKTFCLTEQVALSDGVIFIAQHPTTVLAASYVHATAGSDAGAVNVQLTKDTGTDAPGAGTDLLANNTNAGWNCKGTANTVEEAIFKTTAGILSLSKGDRLSLDFAGTLTALAGVTVTVWVAADID